MVLFLILVFFFYCCWWLGFSSDFWVYNDVLLLGYHCNREKNLHGDCIIIIFLNLKLNEKLKCFVSFIAGYLLIYIVGVMMCLIFLIHEGKKYSLPFHSSQLSNLIKWSHKICKFHPLLNFQLLCCGIGRIC